MRKVYEEIIKEHLRLQKALVDGYESVEIEAIEKFIKRTRGRGKNLTDIVQRDQVRKALRHWAAVIYEKTGEYLQVNLDPSSHGQRMTWPRLFVQQRIAQQRSQKRAVALSSEADEDAKPANLNIDAQACDALVGHLDADLLHKGVQGYLYLSLGACNSNNGKEMLGLAEKAEKIAAEVEDETGKATALAYQGTAYAQINQFGKAKNAYKKAKRIFHRHENQRNESIVAYGLGLIHQQNGDSSEATGYYEEALKLLEGVRREYAAAGKNKQYQDIQTICNDLNGRITSLVIETSHSLTGKNEPRSSR